MDKCVECGATISYNFSRGITRKMKEQRVCFNCHFWLKLVAEKDEIGIARIDHEHYYVGKAESWHGFKGLGGRKFIIKWKDGRRIVTNNLWCQGIIPEHFRDRLPDNAEFLKE